MLYIIQMISCYYVDYNSFLNIVMYMTTKVEPKSNKLYCFTISYLMDIIE